MQFMQFMHFRRGHDKGHIFFKINENFENYERFETEHEEESENFEMDWSKLCGQKCNVEIQIQIKSPPPNEKIVKPPSMAFLDAKEGFMIGCKSGSKCFRIERKIVTQESQVLKELAKNMNSLILDEIDSITLESFLTYCHTGYLPMWAVDEALAFFVEKYKVKNLKDLMDKYLSMSMTGKNARIWMKWAARLKMKNTALRIHQMKEKSKKAWAEVLELEPLLFSNNFSLNQLQIDDIFDPEFNTYIKSVMANPKSKGPAFGKFCKLDFTENIMFN